jgi:carboxyl-terminal processing protease
MKRWYGSQAIACLLMFAFFAAPVCRAQQQQQLTNNERSNVSEMLHDAYNEVKKHYYDPKLQGLDWDARYKQYSARIANAHNMGDGFRTVAAFLSGLKDSHTFFVPPTRAARYDSGYRYALVGKDCFITQIRPKTDAEAKLHIGDQVVGMNGFAVNREDYHDVKYYFDTLAPQHSITFALQSPSGERRQVSVDALDQPVKKTMDLTDGEDYYDLVRRDENEEHATRSRIVGKDDIAFWKLRQFDLDIVEVERNIGIADKHKALILDLRGNHGGSVDTLKWMVGSLFDREIKIGDRVGRKDSKPMIAKRHGKPFDGKLIVLVDAESASAAELLARVVQLEHRGTVIGDRTAGAVMEAKYYPESLGADTKIFYGIQVTDANLIMSDGKSLEKTGVTPDELLLPTAADLAAGSDPVLARAAELAGLKLDPIEAGKMFPFEWIPL